MTLIENVIKQVLSKESISKNNKYSSPPPELDESYIEKRIYKKKKKIVHRYPKIVANVDTSPPAFHPRCMMMNFETYARRAKKLYMDNWKLVTEIKRQLNTGKVDCNWVRYPEQRIEFYEKRRNFLKHVQNENKLIYERIVSAKARVETTASLERSWQHNRREIVARAAFPFVLFPPVPSEDVDPVFLPPPGYKRPRVRISLRVVGGASLGALTIELFTDVCPLTCKLFAGLLQGDGHGHCYVGTTFFRKVPNLYWSGGDVIYDNGCGCYVQPGKRMPLGAENYHYPHSMPGLVSMRMTCDDEMCGIFNITFKPLPQFDLKNVVFARVVRPSLTYDNMSIFGTAMGVHPVVRIESAKILTRGSEDAARGKLEDCLPTVQSIENTLPTNVENTLPTNFENSLPTNFENSLPTNFENSLPANVENSLPTNIENSLPTNFKNSLPTNFENSLPANAENYFPTTCLPNAKSMDNYLPMMRGLNIT